MKYNLKLGSKGEDVKTLQIRLTTFGYDVGAVDGVFGTKTETALKKLQESYGIAATGVLGPWLGEKIGMEMRLNAPNKTIVITAGHSNKDPGAVNGSRTEAQIVAEMRNIVASKLRNKGYNVLTDGEGTINNTLNEAVKLIPKGMLAVEFHLNAAANKTAGGVEALAGSKHREFCKDLCGSIAKVMGNKVRGSDGGWKAESSGQHTRLAYVSNGGVILETYFISNESELAKYDNNKDAICNSIVEAISRYVG